MMQAQALEGGFANAPVDSALAFRQIMQAMARPGQILTVTGAVPPSTISSAAGVILLTLCDPDTPIYLAPSVDTPDLRGWITFHTGAPVVAPEQSQFALGRWEELCALQFPIGTPEYPDRSATLIVEADDLTQGGATLAGPGIRDKQSLTLPETAFFQRNAALFPLGLDFFFTSGATLAALPRTTKVS